MSFSINSSSDKSSPWRTFGPMGSQLRGDGDASRSHAASSVPVSAPDADDAKILGLTDDQSIRVGENALSFQDVLDLLNADKVKDLNFCTDIHRALTKDELYKLFDALKNNSSLQSLNLSGQSGYCFIPLIEGYLNSGICRLQKLNLQNCGIGLQELETLSQVMKKQTSLIEVLLDGNLQWENDYKVFWNLIRIPSSSSASSTSKTPTPEKNVWDEIKDFLKTHHFIFDEMHNWAFSGDMYLDNEMLDCMMKGFSLNQANAIMDEHLTQKAVELLQYKLLEKKDQGPLPLPMELEMIKPSNMLYRAIYVELRLNLIKSALLENSQPAIPAPSAFDAAKLRARL